MKAHAEFPGDRIIRFALARALASAGADGQPGKANVQEAEKILWDLIRQADDDDFRYECIKRLALIYKDYWHDEHGYEEIVGMLPELRSCREPRGSRMRFLLVGLADVLGADRFQKPYL